MDGLSGIWILFTYLANYTEFGKFLPISPFQRFLVNWDGFDVIRRYLAYVNWFVPISTILDILIIWLSAIAVFYAVMAIMRWIKIVGD